MVKALRIKDFPDYYITDTGDVYSRKEYHNPQGRIRKLKQCYYRGGYLQVNLCERNIRCIKKVHRLVAEAFIPNPENKPQVNHKNGIRDDNRACNLEWVMPSENLLHSYRVLHRKHPRGMLGKLGKDHNRSKTVLQIKDGKIIAEYGSVAEATRMTGINNISDCCLGKRRHNTAGGYSWKYK